MSTEKNWELCDGGNRAVHFSKVTRHEHTQPEYFQHCTMVISPVGGHTEPAALLPYGHENKEQ